MKKYFLSSLLVIIAITFYACSKTVHLPLKDTYPHIVIQGEVTDTVGPYTIQINQSADFYSENIFPAISGAVVKIHDDHGNSDSLIETSAGIYSTQTLVGHVGYIYTATVLLHDTLYTASSTMPSVVPLDSVTIKHENIFGSKSIYAQVNFQDPAGVNNYYQFQEYVNGVYLNKDIIVFDDRLSDGRYITRTLFNDSTRMQVGDSLEVRMYCIDKPIFDYFNQLEGTGSNNNAAPANPTSNFDNGALGYFSAHTVQTRKVKVY